MQYNGTFSPVMKYMECIYFERSRCGVSKRVYAPYLPCDTPDERKIDHVTPSREKIHLGPKPLPRQCTLSFLENRSDKTGTPANLITFWFDIRLGSILSIPWI